MLHGVFKSEINNYLLKYIVFTIQKWSRVEYVIWEEPSFCKEDNRSPFFFFIVRHSLIEFDIHLFTAITVVWIYCFSYC